MSAVVVAASSAAPAPARTVSVVTRAGELLAASWEPERVWFAPSGTRVTGEEAARHLEAVLELLEAKGWIRASDTEDGPEDPGELESTTVPGMLRYLTKLLTSVIRYEYFSDPPGLLLWQAMERVDRDVQQVAGACMNLILRASTGAPTASYYWWSQREGRTFDEVRDLLTTAGAFARQYGPGATV